MGGAVSMAFWAGVALGKASGVVNDALDSVHDAAEAVMGYLRTAASSAYEAAAFVKDRVVKPVCDKASAATDYLRRAASSAFEKLKAAAAFVKDTVIKLVRRLRGHKETAAAKSEVDRAAAAQDDAGLDDVLSRASARVAGCGPLLDARALPPPSPAIVVSATAPGGALALQGSVAALATRAERRASEMMARLKTVVAALGDNINIPEDARSCIFVVVAAVGIGLEVIAATAVAADA